jgi:hypothetical protein
MLCKLSSSSATMRSKISCTIASGRRSRRSSLCIEPADSKVDVARLGPCSGSSSEVEEEEETRCATPPAAPRFNTPLE